MNATSGSGNVYRLLIVDDNRAIHEDFRKILSSTNESAELDNMEAELFGEEVSKTVNDIFEIDSALQGQEGYEMVRKAKAENRPYSLAFIDMRMPPGWDGIETIEHIWQEDPELQVVICSAYSDHSWSEISQRLGSSNQLLILKKPFDNIEIIQMAHAMSQKCTLQRVESKLVDLDRKLQSQLPAMSDQINEQHYTALSNSLRSAQVSAEGLQDVAHLINNLVEAIKRGEDPRALQTKYNLASMDVDMPGELARLTQSLQQLQTAVNQMR